MAGPYQRLANGQSADSGAQAITTVVNSVEAGLEDAEADITALEASVATKAASSHTHTGVYDPAGSAATAQAAAIQRANHTGTQLASTISDFNTAVRTNRLDQLAAPTTAVGMGSQRITGVATPTALTDAATKAYVDVATGGFPNPTEINMLAEGVVCDGKVITVNTTSGSPTLTCTGSTYPEGASVFSADSVGMAVWIPNGTGTTWFRTTVTGYTSPTVVTMAANAQATSTGITAMVGTDNTSAINTVVAAANAGDTLYFPGGEYWYMTDGDHEFTQPRCAVRGDGWHRTKFSTSHLTNDIFLFTEVSGNALAERMGGWHASFNCGVTAAGLVPTAGAFVAQRSTAGFGTTTVVWVQNEFRDLAAVGFYDNIASVGGGIQTLIAGCYTYGAIRAEIILNSDGFADMGNFVVRNCVITGNPLGGYGILWQGGGNTQIIDNMFAGYDTSIRFQPSVSTGSNFTSNIRIAGNSFEDIENGYGIHFSTTTAFDYYNVTINNNTFGSTLGPIYCEATSTSHIRFGTYAYYGLAIVGNSGNGEIYVNRTQATRVLANAMSSTPVTGGTTTNTTVTY